MMQIVDTPEPTNPGSDGDPHDPALPEAIPLKAVPAAAVTAQRYKTNVTTLTERIAIRLAGEGAEHPVAAAVTIAVRGMLGAEPAEYATALDLAPADLRALEAGTVSLSDLPPSLWRLVHDHGLEPVMLVDLEHQLRG